MKQIKKIDGTIRNPLLEKALSYRSNKRRGYTKDEIEVALEIIKGNVDYGGAKIALGLSGSNLYGLIVGCMKDAYLQGLIKIESKL